MRYPTRQGEIPETAKLPDGKGKKTKKKFEKN